jgi:hypothetical protein
MVHFPLVIDHGLTARKIGHRMGEPNDQWKMNNDQ